MADISTMSEGGTDDSGKKVWYGPVAGKENTATYGFYYADGSPVPASKLVNNTTAAGFANAGWDVGFGPGVSPAQNVYGKVISGDTGLSVLKETAPTYGDATYDPKNKIVIVRDSNGTSIYNQKGMLISGRGSVNRIGVAAGSGGNAPQIDINGVGAYGTPEYKRNIANLAKQNLAYAGSDLQQQAFGAIGTAAAPFTVNGKPYTGVAGGRNYVNGVATDGAGDASTGSLTDSFLSSTANLGTSGTSSPLTTAADDQKKADRVSAYNLLYSEFDKYGLGTLVSDIKNYLIDNTFDPSEFSIQLKNTPAYQARFSANADRIKAGLAALKPAEYIALEDQYQNLMRNYGLPESYYAKGDRGIQEGFNKLLASDVSPTELEDRITTAQQRVVNADPNVLKTLKAYYPDITNGDILAYTLDPKNAMDMIKRKVTAAEIGGVQYGAGFNKGTAADEAQAMALAKAGVTGAQYAQAAPFISQAAERGSQLADIYGQGLYNQATAEAEALNLSGGAQAAAKRKKLTSLESASFSGSSGVGALGRDKAIYGSTYGQAGLV